MPNKDMTNSAVEEGITRHSHLWARLLSLLSDQCAATGIGYQSFRVEESLLDCEYSARICSRYMDANGVVYEFTETLSLGFMYGPVTDA